MTSVPGITAASMPEELLKRILNPREAGKETG